METPFLFKQVRCNTETISQLSHQSQPSPYMLYHQLSPFNADPSSVSFNADPFSVTISAANPEASSAHAAGTVMGFLLTCLVHYVFDFINLFITTFLTPNFFCNTCLGYTREEKVASLDANHMKA